MRGRLLCLVVLGLAAAGPAAAQVQVAKATPATGAEKPAAKAAPAAGEKDKPDVLAELQQLRQLLLDQRRELEAQRALLREQQQKMEALERRVAEENAARAEAAAAAEVAKAEDVRLLEGQLEAVADSQKELGDRVAGTQKDLAATKSSTEGKLRGLGNFTFSGDLRLRAETFNSGTLTTPRYRARYRLRFNTNAKLNDEISGGLTIASGDATDPISTNQTFTQFFTRKFFAIDKAFVSYQPKWFARVGGGELDLTGGKYAYTWYRTELTLDNDLNPEGLSQSVSWKLKNPVLERVALVGFQNFIAESGSGPDTTMYGGQLQLFWTLGNRVRLSTYAGFYDYHNADAIRAAQSNVTVRVTGGPCVPVPPSTTPVCVTQGIPNTTQLNGSTNSNAATSTQFASKFGLLDATARLDIQTPSARWPLMAQLNFVNNTRACTNLVNIPSGAPACNPRDRSGYWAEMQLGALRERGDWNFGYTFIRLEREAILAAFNFSDLRAPSNAVTSRLNVGYQAYRNIQVNWTGLFGRQLVTTSSPTEENQLRRMQFDLLYKF